MKSLPVRLAPGADVRRALETTLAEQGVDAAFVVAGIGSLSRARLRFAGRPDAELLDGDLEILTLAGSISRDGAHLHMSIADASGRVVGGHVAYDCIVRTTAEILVVMLLGWSFSREMDGKTGYPELRIQPCT